MNLGFRSSSELQGEVDPTGKLAAFKIYINTETNLNNRDAMISVILQHMTVSYIRSLGQKTFGTLLHASRFIQFLEDTSLVKSAFTPGPASFSQLQ